MFYGGEWVIVSFLGSFFFGGGEGMAGVTRVECEGSVFRPGTAAGRV